MIYLLLVAFAGWTSAAQPDPADKFAEMARKSGLAPIHYAAVNGEDEKLAALLKEGVDPNLPAEAPKSGVQADFASRPRDTWALRYDAEPGMTPLHFAAAAGAATTV